MITNETVTRATVPIASLAFGNFFVNLCLLSISFNKLYTAIEKDA